MASLAQIDEYYRPPSGPSPIIGQFLVTDVHFASPKPEIKSMETGLRSGLKIEYSGDLGEALNGIVARLLDFERRETGWDSYGGRSLNDKAVMPAFKLILEGIKKCQQPRLQLTGAGELDLIWESDNRYLEVTAHADGTYDISFEDAAEGEEFESDGPASYDEALAYLARFCSVL